MRSFGPDNLIEITWCKSPSKGELEQKRKQTLQKKIPRLNAQEFSSFSTAYNPPQECAMHTHRFGRKLKLPSTIAIKHEIRKLMFEDSVNKAEAGARAEAIRGQLREETRPLVQLGWGAEDKKTADESRSERAISNFHVGSFMGRAAWSCAPPTKVLWEENNSSN
jgi:hypothetical protein